MGNAAILRQSNGPWRIFETRVKPGGEVTLGALEGGISEAVVRRGIEAHTQSREGCSGSCCFLALYLRVSFLNFFVPQ